MKKLLALALAAITVFSFASCAKDEKKTAETGTETEDSAPKGAYAELSVIEGVELGVEEYGIAFRAGSDMVKKVDDISATLFENGTILEIAQKYEVDNQLVPSFEKATGQEANTADSDWEYIKKNGKMIIGVTDYDPMDYKDADGKWIGFDAEYAEAVCAELGVEVSFLEIDWDSKEMALQTKQIDCVWNGMTITPALLASCDITGAYMKNYQVVVVKDAAAYTTLESLAGKKIVAEAGSAGETAAQENEFLSEGYKAVTSQADALLEVKSGSAEACVIDFIMANSLLNK